MWGPKAGACWGALGGTLAGRAEGYMAEGCEAAGWGTRGCWGIIGAPPG